MTTPNICQLAEFSILRLSGEETYSFLQGQVTCDINKLSEQDWLPGCHCNAKGKMWSTFIAIKHKQDVLLILTKESAQQTLAELSKYGVFAKVTISDDTKNWSVYGSNTPANAEYNIQLADSHFLLVNSLEIEEQEPNSAEWWETEILSGRAHLLNQTVGEYVPQMLNLQALDYISFNKGCYMGQEMVARMRYLGKNKRALYLAKSEQPVKAEAGNDVAIMMNNNLRNIGKIIQSQTLENHTVFQLVLPKDTELTQTIYLNSEQSLPLTLLELPYLLDEQG